jgi:hypothetical protein
LKSIDERRLPPRLGPVSVNGAIFLRVQIIPVLNNPEKILFLDDHSVGATRTVSFLVDAQAKNTNAHAWQIVPPGCPSKAGESGCFERDLV